MKIYDKIEDSDSKINSTNVQRLNVTVHMIIEEDAFSFSKSVRSINHQYVKEVDNLFSNVLNQVKKIVKGIDPDGIIRISKQQIVALGFVDVSTFEEEWLQKVFTQIERDLIIDTDQIKAKMKNRIFIS